MPSNPTLSNAPITTSSATPISVPNFSPPVPTTRIGDVVRNSASIPTLSFPLDMPKLYFFMDIAKYSRASLLKLGTLTTDSYIYLPVPIQMMDHMSVAYDPQNLGMATGALFDQFNKSIEQLRIDQVQSHTNAAPAKRIGEQVGAVAAVAAATVLQAAPALSTTARAMYGYAPNQFLTILLKGPEYKVFELTWKFSPNKPEEATNLRLIVQKLNNSMSPGIGVGGAVFTFPDVFRLGFMPNSKYMYKFKPAVLMNFAVNYAPGGMAAFYRADAKTENLQAPEGMEIRCKFMELEYWLNGDFNDTNDPYDTTTGRKERSAYDILYGPTAPEIPLP